MPDILLNKQVLYTLLCQHNSSTGEGASLALVAKWLAVSKPTAKKLMDAVTSENMVILTREHYRSNIHKLVYLPTQETWNKWREGEYSDDYLLWRNARVNIGF